MNELLVETVMRLVESVPAGSVATYGDLAEVVGTGPRQVARILVEWGSSGPWWRIVNAKGLLPGYLMAEAAVRWSEEGTPRANPRECPGVEGVDIRAARIGERALLEAHSQILVDLRKFDR